MIGDNHRMSLPSCTIPDSTRALTDAAGTLHQAVSADEARIVSLVPSLTELLCDLGLTGSVVGRTGFCIHPRPLVRGIPKVGGTKDVRLDRVRELAPTHVVLNIDENTRETAEALARFVPHLIVTHPCAPQDNFALYALFGAIFGRQREAEVLSAALSAALADAAELRRQLGEEQVLYLIWREPWMTVARDTYIAGMLEQVGWRCLPADAESRYPSFEWGAPWLSGVDRVLLSSEPYRFRAADVTTVGKLCGKACMLIDGEQVSWYGSRAVSGLRYLTALRRSLAASTACRAAPPPA